MKIFIDGGTDLSVLSIYNPNENVTLNELRHYLRQMGNKYIVVGDFNAHSSTLSTDCLHPNTTGRNIEDLLVSEQICLINPINFYTYLNAATGRRSCLDLCFTSPNIAMDAGLQQLSDVGSDHLPVQMTLQLQPLYCGTIGRPRWKTTPDNLVEFSQQVQPTKMSLPSGVDEFAKDLSQRIYSAATDSIPRTTGVLKPHKRTVWWDADCSKAVAERRHARRMLEKHPTYVNVQSYREKTREARRICQAKKRESFRAFISDIHYDTPTTVVWKKVKSLKGYSIQNPEPLESDGAIVTDPTEKANIYAKTFQAASKLGPHQEIPDYQIEFDAACRLGKDEMYNCDVSLEEIEFAINHARNTSPGIDDIPYSFLQSLSWETKQELLLLMNQCFKTGVIPEIWKMGLTIPIVKPGKPKNLASSYRPITMLSCIGKTMERVVHRRLEYLVENSNMLSYAQCGFRKGQGTIDVLLRLEHCIRSSLSTQKVCLVAYLDLKSAFDTVWGKGLVYKLIKAGVKGNIVRWLHNYFCDRSIVVQIGKDLSESVRMEAGTPQGAVLSPLLFNIMLSDMPQEDGVLIHTYADDITVSCDGEKVNNVRSKLQNYLNTFKTWAATWGLIINPKKTYIQHFTRRKMACPVVQLQGLVLEYKKEQKLLGMVLDSPLLTWEAHVVGLRRDCIKRIDIMKTLSSAVWGHLQRCSDNSI
jgi:hypothetical protein